MEERILDAAPELLEFTFEALRQLSDDSKSIMPSKLWGVHVGEKIVAFSSFPENFVLGDAIGHKGVVFMANLEPLIIVGGKPRNIHVPGLVNKKKCSFETLQNVLSFVDQRRTCIGLGASKQIMSRCCRDVVG